MAAMMAGDEEGEGDGARSCRWGVVLVDPVQQIRPRNGVARRIFANAEPADPRRRKPKK